MANPGIALQDLDRRPERNASQRSTVSAETDITSSNNINIRASEEADLEAQPTQTNGRQTLLSPESQQSTRLPGHPPVVDDSDVASDNDDDDSSLAPAKGKTATYFSVFAWWKPELFASLLSVVTLGCIIAVLRRYDGSLLTELDLPRYLTLNGVVAALATVNRACLNTPVCSALLQQMWLYLAKESKVKGSPRSRLRDLELYTDASTGAWGSLVFLCKARMSRIAACFGCAITILSLAFSTFTQQLISIELVPLANTTSPGNLARSETYSQLAIDNQRLSIYPPLDIIASVYSGMLGKDVGPVQASCPTANCTWPITPSVAVCGACAESAFVPQGCNTSCSRANSDCRSTPNMYCNYSLPSGNAVQLFDFVGQTMMPASNGAGFHVVPSFVGSKFKREQDERAYIANFELFGVPFGFSLPDNPNIMSVPTPKPKSLDLKATKCALWMCVQAYNTSVFSNIQHEDITETFDSVNATNWLYSSEKSFQLPTVPADLDRNGSTNFTVARQAAGTLETFFHNNLRGNVTLAPGQYESSSDLVYGVWNGSTNASLWISNVATSMTNAMRTADSISRDQHNGTQYGLAVVVRWNWLFLPAALVAASLVYLFVVIFQTANSPVRSWKGSPLTLLLFELDPSISQASYGQVDKQGGLMKSVGDTKVRMATHAGGIRKLHAC